MSMPCLHSASVADESSVDVDDRFCEEGRGLLCPDSCSRQINSVHQIDYIGFGKAPTEVPFGGWVGEALGAQGIEIDLVIASQFDVLDPFSAGHNIEGDVKDVIGFVIRVVPLKDMEVVVDIADQANPPRQ